MRKLLGPVFWLGRVSLWVVFLPLGVWRSLRHHRKKGVREVQREMKKTRAH